MGSPSLYVRGSCWLRRISAPLLSLSPPLCPPSARRASVVIPLCNVDGVASVLFTKRSGRLRAHKNEVCFPGGKVRGKGACQEQDVQP